MRVIPKEGLRLIDAETGQEVPPEGIDVRDNDLYWVRRIRDGDCTKQEAPPPEGGEGEGAGRRDRRTGRGVF